MAPFYEGQSKGVSERPQPWRKEVKGRVRTTKGCRPRLLVKPALIISIAAFYFFRFFVNKLFTAHHMPEVNNGVSHTTVTRVLRASVLL